jgi:hypothetical protein
VLEGEGSANWTMMADFADKYVMVADIVVTDLSGSAR